MNKVHYHTFMIEKSSIGPSPVLLVITPRAFLSEICIAASISLEHSKAVELAAATTAATVPNFAEPVPLKEFTASLWAFRTNCVALTVKRKRKNIKINKVLKIGGKLQLRWFSKNVMHASKLKARCTE